jgi:hypothetical protein
MRTLGLFAALGIIGGAFAVPAMAQTTNQVPVAQADVASTAEDTAVTIAVMANDSDPDGGTLAVAGFVNAAHGTVTAAAGNSLTYTPTANFAGTDTFTYTLTDGQGGSATGTVTVTVTPVADPPTAVADAAVAAATGTTTIAVLTNDSDVDGDTLTVTAVTQGAHGTVAVVAGSVTYTPTAGFIGTDTFTYTISDGNGGTAIGTVVVTVGGNRPPVATNDAVNVKKDTAKTITVLGNDSDPDANPLTVTGTTSPAHGVAVVNADNTITYTPVTGYLGTDVFTYTISDGANTATATVNITVKANIDDNPVGNTPEDKDDCKKGGWHALEFKNQGQCVSFANHQDRDDDDRRAHDDDDGDNDDDDDDDDKDHGKKNKAKKDKGNRGRGNN